jgi:asparagine synthase (glutamine-hydrolysing)
MCGIAGILKLDPRERADRHRLVRMRDVLSHRGPDEEGLMLDGPVGLAHRRLAIVDINAGQQPMSNEDGCIWITFNGEIYNHSSLRARLEAGGHRYRSHCDTETILHLYEDKGDEVVEHLHGMFAFAIWDGTEQRLLLARDRLGIKPLYYASSGTELLFASEIKSLLAAGSFKSSFNQAVLPEFLAAGFVSGEETFFRGIRKLLPGQVISWSRPGGFRRHRYWQPPRPVEHGSTIRSAVPELRRRLEAAVRSHLMSDVPLGVFLSGGLDSSALAALVARAVNEPIRTFAVGFADGDANELEYARLAARSIGAEHREVVVSPREYFEALPTLIWHEDEPIAFPSSVPLFFVSRLARKHVKVVLTGEGADELFLGYNRYRVTFWNERLGRPYWAAVPPRLRRQIRSLIDALPRAMGRYARRTFFALEPGVRNLFLENFAVFPQSLQHCLLADRQLISDRDPYATWTRCYDERAGSFLNRLSHVDLQTYLQELLMKQDQMSMAASLESRVPFLDDQLVEHVAAMPAAFKLRRWQTKAILRAAVRDLVPPAILSRPKMGFPVPVGRWLREEFWPIVEDFVLGQRARARGLFDPQTVRWLADEHRSGRTANGERLWLLLNLEMWLRITCDGEAPADVARAVSLKRSKVFHANPMGEDGRVMAADDRRPRPQRADPFGALAAPFRHPRHDSRA